MLSLTEVLMAAGVAACMTGVPVLIFYFVARSLQRLWRFLNSGE
jgi:uncharacterized membrane protein HdeD (DUF308 family)